MHNVDAAQIKITKNPRRDMRACSLTLSNRQYLAFAEVDLSEFGLGHPDPSLVFYPDAFYLLDWRPAARGRGCGSFAIPEAHSQHELRQAVLIR